MKVLEVCFPLLFVTPSWAFTTLYRQQSSWLLQWNSLNTIHHHNKETALKNNDENASFSAFAEAISEEDLVLNGEDMLSSDMTRTPTWQESLEKLIDPTTPGSKRQILLGNLVNANENIRKDLTAAFRDRNIDPILTPTGKRLQDGTRAVARQLSNDIIPKLTDVGPTFEDLPTLVPKVGPRVMDAFSNQIGKSLEMLQGDLADPTRIPGRITQQASDLANEARNIFLGTPEGYSGPKYVVLARESDSNYEVRDYEGYSVASSSMTEEGENYSIDDVTKGGAAFNALAAYLFGANDEAKSMDMTTPVATTSSGEMRFYLKTDGTDTFPNPLSREERINESGAVKIVDVPPARLAVARFAGFATEGEVLRQKDALLTKLAIDGVEVDVPHGAVVPHVVFQYNPPYTIPIVRRNEIAVPVLRNGETEEPKADLGMKWEEDKLEGDVNSGTDEL